MNNRRVGLMGGTFDPIHIGHLMLAQNALEALTLDRILFMPTGCSYLKAGTKVADREDRYAMTKLAVADNPSFSVSRMEIDREGNTYTADTLHELHALEPETEWYLLLGADSLNMLERWVRPQTICDLATLVCAVRGDQNQADVQKTCEHLQTRFGARTHILPVGRMDLSSSAIRERIAAGRSVRYMLRDSVISYIEEHKLYQ